LKITEKTFIEVQGAQISNGLFISLMQEEYQVPGCQIGTHCVLLPYPYIECSSMYISGVSVN